MWKIRIRNHLWIVFCLALSGSVALVQAQTRSDVDVSGFGGGSGDPRGEPELTVCSQNLKNYAGEGFSEDYSPKELALASRFIKARCDVIALQEVVGLKQSDAEKVVKRLATVLRHRSGRVFEGKVGEIVDGSARVGFLVAKDRAEITNSITYRKIFLPKIDDNQKPRQFSRAPLELQLLVKGKGEAPPKTVGVVTFHFKSKSGAQGDPAGLEWETARMEMAEGLRKIVADRYQQSFADGSIPLVVMGDRNSNFDTASARILDGTLSLLDFKGQAKCRLSKRGAPLCQAGVQKAGELFSVLTTDPQSKQLPGTFVYKKVYSWLDDILMSQSSLAFARAASQVEGDYDSGVISDYKEASDHALVWARLNW